ncbi:MAG: CrcB family protein [Muribaculaceae bacterium]|nr:CrcB family protein [Muribaculaceae bacterium]MDE7081777.1 CrcB family protein [Muribaculaceae bacterium]
MSIWIRIALVAIAGGIGAAARYLIELLLKSTPLGFATWVINSVGCLLIGIFSGWLANTDCGWSEQTRTAFTLLSMTGFCGGFSTFSSFTLDSVKYYEAGQFLTWLIFGGMTIFVGLFGCALGYYIGKHL